jgi:glutamate-1-semialdehyde 2,1-aminomutase
MTALDALFQSHAVPIRLQGLPQAFHACFDTGTSPVTTYAQLQQFSDQRYADFARRLIEAGVWVAYRGIWYVSAAHTDQDVNETIERVDAALTAP